MIAAIINRYTSQFLVVGHVIVSEYIPPTVGDLVISKNTIRNSRQSLSELKYFHDGDKDCQGSYFLRGIRVCLGLTAQNPC
jgi:hypothetical protein